MGKNVHPTSAVKNLKKGKTKMANINILQMIEQCQVEWKMLGEVAMFYGGLTGKNKSDFEKGNAKYITYKNIFGNLEIDPDSLEMVTISVNEKQNQVKYGDVLFTGSSEIAKEAGISSAITTLFDEPIYLNSFSFGLRFNDDVDLIPEFTKYLFRSNFVRKQIVKTASGVTRFNISKERFKKIIIPIPPLPIQKEIVKILDKFTELEATLEAELSLREKQYTFYRDHLSTFGDDLEWKCLGEVVPLQRGKRLVKNQLLENAKYAVFQNSLQPLGYFSESNCRAYMTFIISAGAAGEIGFSNEEFWACDDCYYFDCPKESLNDKFLYYFLKLKQHKLLSQVRKASVPRLSRISIEKLKIPLPPLATQQKIVDILDKFETLTHSITEGLPKEIELRRKQYEYYREKLLTFPKQ
ncbi:restriction endonuclease subunit S [Pasteurella multocida]